MSLQLSPEKLVAARKSAGISQQRAAAHINVALSTLQAAEYGRHEPRASVVASLACLYDVDLQSLFDRIHDCDGSGPEASLRPPNGGEVQDTGGES